MTDEGEDIRVTVQEKNRDILIRQNDKDGITVRIAASKKGKKPEINATAATAKELKALHPEAYAVYRKYLENKLKELRTEIKSQEVIPLNEQQKSENPAENLLREQLNRVLQDPNVPVEQKRLIEKMLAQ